MFELQYAARSILSFVSAGNLKNKDGFLHSDRQIDTFVLLFCKEGQLCIAQEERKYALSPNQYLLLFPGMRHYGYERTSGILDYYWCHFSIRDPSMRIQPQCILNTPSEFVSIPEYGDCKQADRISIQFRHLIDISRRKMGTPAMMDFSISLLMQELAYLCSGQNASRSKTGRNHPMVASVMDFVHSNFSNNISVKMVADNIGFNACYVSTVFKQCTGITLIQYINQVRIETAKDLLLNSTSSLNLIAAQVGFEDEKYFVKLFRSMVNLTPTQYRNVYTNHVNKA